MAILGVGHLMEVLRTVIIVEHLTGIREQGLHVFPNPIGAIADDAESHRLLGNQASIFDLLQGFAQVIFALHLMPTEQMHNASAVEQVEPKPCGLIPIMSPPRPPRPGARLAGAASPRLLGTRRHIGALNPSDQYGAAKTAGGPLGYALLNRGTRWGHIQHAESLGHLIGEGVQALTTDRDATETATQR